jgi:hypothetical protein
MNEDVVCIDVSGVPPEQVQEWMKNVTNALEKSREGGRTEMIDVLPKIQTDELIAKDLAD